MKTGKILAITAALLLTGSLVWSIFTLVTYPSGNGKNYPEQAFLAKETDSSRVYTTAFIHNMEVDFPGLVVLDTSFCGVEFYGDTASLNTLNVNQLNHTLVISNSKVLKVPGTTLNARIGIGGRDRSDMDYKFSFGRCAKVTANHPIAGHNLTLSCTAGEVDLALFVDGLSLFARGNKEAGSMPHLFQLSGQVNRFIVMSVQDVTLDASQLQSKEVYGRMFINSTATLYATEIANVQKKPNFLTQPNLPESNIRIEGNPKYQLVR
jgi:hypothetical protein